MSVCTEDFDPREIARDMLATGMNHKRSGGWKSVETFKKQEHFSGFFNIATNRAKKVFSRLCIGKPLDGIESNSTDDEGKIDTGKRKTARLDADAPETPREMVGSYVVYKRGEFDDPATERGPEIYGVITSRRVKPKGGHQYVDVMFEKAIKVGGVKERQS